MVLGEGAFFLHQFLAPHFHIFRVGLAQVVVTEALAGAQVAAALRIAPNQRLHTPLRIRGRTRAPATEVLLVLNLQRADIPLDLTEFLVYGGHGKCERGEIPA